MTGHHEIDAERALLGAMLSDPEAVNVATEVVTGGALDLDAHRKTFEAIVALRKANDPVDTVTVAGELRRRGELQVVGGFEALSDLLQYAGATENIPSYAKIIKRGASRRRILAMALELQKRAEANEDVADLAAYAAHEAANAEALAQQRVGGRFAAAALSAPDLLAAEIPSRRSLIGDRALCAGGFAILYGQPGLGKSWLALTLGRSLVRGEPWLGLEIQRARVGVLQLELPGDTMQSRLRLLGIGDGDDEFRIVCRPRLQGAVDLFLEQRDLADLKAWILADRLDVLVVDALSRAHTADENSGVELGRVLAALDALRHETGCALVIVHHEPKAVGRDKDAHLDFLRGHSRLKSDPTLCVRVLESRGLHRLVFAKVSEGRQPADVCFHIEDGRLEVVPSPESVGNANRERVLRAVLSTSKPVSRREVEQITGLARSAAAKHLQALVEDGSLDKIGENRAARYCARPSAASSPSARDGVDGPFFNGGNRLDVEDLGTVHEPGSGPSAPSTPSALKGGTVDGRLQAQSGLPVEGTGA